MKIIVFSEVKWTYLSTRKRQLISRFPKHWQILFLEPYKIGHPNSFYGTQEDNITYVTVPFLKNFKSKTLAKIFSFRLIRWLHYLILKVWIVEVMRQHAFHSADVVYISNLYAVPVLNVFSSAVPVIYDQNDNHLAFPNTPKWLEKHFDKLCKRASKIVSVSEELALNLPENNKKEIVGNGVNVALFESKPLIVYVGAISEWVDVELLHKIAENETWNLRLIGPVSVDLKGLLKKKNVQNVILPQELAFEQMRAANVLIVPFLRNNLTRDAYTINKLYEYMLTDSTIITTNFSNGLRRYRDFIITVNTHEEFISALKLSVRYDFLKFDAAERRRFAELQDWSFRAKEMQHIIETAYKDVLSTSLNNRLKAHKEIDET